MNDLWIYLSLLSAVTLVLSDVFAKKVARVDNEYLVAWLRMAFSLPLLILCSFFTVIPAVDREFMIAFVVALPLEILAAVLYIKALRSSPLNLTLPFLSLTPLFLILFSWLVLNEPVSTQGGAGIVLISLGGYFLNIDTLVGGILAPLKAIFREKGSLFMIVTAFIYSITSSLGKVGVMHSSPLFFATTYFLAVTVVFTPLALRMNRLGLAAVTKRDWVMIILSGFTFSLMIISHMFAIERANVAYMIAIKRTSMLIGIVLGYLFFRESRAGQRFLGAFVMLIGFVLIVTS